MQRETPGSYELLIPQGHHTTAISITAQDDAEAIERAWTYVLDHPAIVAATLQESGRIVGHLSRQA